MNNASKGRCVTITPRGTDAEGAVNPRKIDRENWRRNCRIATFPKGRAELLLS